MFRRSELPVGTCGWHYLFAAWCVALAATLSAVFIGKVMGPARCTLCWYQRIFMFPLAILLAPAVTRQSRKSTRCYGKTSWTPRPSN